MEARASAPQWAILAVCLSLLANAAAAQYPQRGGQIAQGMGAPGARSQNFVVTAPTRELAAEICQAAEAQRRDLAVEWLGRELPPWRQPIPVWAEVHPDLGAGGATSFRFDRGMPFDWSMKVQGTRERVLDSVLPHEISHAVFATHFGAPLPRWADEGACTTVEHDSERKKHEGYLIRFLHTDRGIPFNTMFALKQYPRDMLPLYAQGYSVARYLIGQGGKRKFIEFVGDGMRSGDWTAAVNKFYQFENLSALQVIWLEWVRNGSPFVPSDVALAGGESTIPAAFTPGGGAAYVATPVVDRNPAQRNPGQFASVQAAPQKGVVPHAGGQYAYGYADPQRPAQAFGRPGDPSMVSRPASGGWYAASRDARQQRGPLPPAPLTPSTVYSPTTTGDEEAAQDDQLVPLAAPPSPPAATPSPNRVLMQWTRPESQPWLGQKAAAREAIADVAVGGDTVLR